MENIDQLKESVGAIVDLTSEEWSVFSSPFDSVRLKKNDYFLNEGQICDYIGFINKGVLAYFKTCENGNEMTTDFVFENEWVTYNQSRLNNSPSSINIKAIEPSELLVIKQTKLTDLYVRIPKLERLGRILMEQAFLKIAQQSMSLQILTAKERYENLLKNHPEIFQKVPLYHIANYLGIAPKSLSRIRKEIF